MASVFQVKKGWIEFPTMAEAALLVRSYMLKSLDESPKTKRSGHLNFVLQQHLRGATT